MTCRCRGRRRGGGFGFAAKDLKHAGGGGAAGVGGGVDTRVLVSPAGRPPGTQDLQRPDARQGAVRRLLHGEYLPEAPRLSSSMFRDLRLCSSVLQDLSAAVYSSMVQGLCVFIFLYTSSSLQRYLVRCETFVALCFFSVQEHCIYFPL